MSATSQEEIIEMKYMIHHKDDSLLVEGNTIDDLVEVVKRECLIKRMWHEEDCWSEKLE